MRTPPGLKQIVILQKARHIQAPELGSARIHVAEYLTVLPPPGGDAREAASDNCDGAGENRRKSESGERITDELYSQIKWELTALVDVALFVRLPQLLPDRRCR